MPPNLNLLPTTKRPLPNCSSRRIRRLFDDRSKGFFASFYQRLLDHPAIDDDYKEELKIRQAYCLENINFNQVPPESYTHVQLPTLLKAQESSESTAKNGHAAAAFLVAQHYSP